MGRFLNPRAAAVAAPIAQVARAVAPVAILPPPVEAAPAGVALKREYASVVHRIGLIAVCAYLISGYATDLSYRFLGAKPYLSMVSGLVAFACFLFSGRALVALRTTVGKLWFALMCWMLMSVVFSRWPGGSFEMMQTYLGKQHLVLFYMTAVTLTVENTRTVFRACILGAFILVLTCMFFGGADEGGRFGIPTNIYLSNPNDLAMQLLLCLGFFLFLVKQPGWFGRVAGIGGLIGSALYLLKTGSRGAMLAAIVFAILWMIFNENRVRLALTTIPIVIVLFALLPHETIGRLSMIMLNPEETVLSNADQEAARQSQLEREHLFRASVSYAIHNPIFGLGPGRFPDAIWEDAKREGRHEASLGTHNTYTQVASECGIPALIFFAGALVVTIRSSLRLYRATRNDPSQAVVSAMSFSLFIMMVAFGIDLFFHHVAYSGNLAMVLGLWVSLELATRQAAAVRAAAAQ
jgi:O-antigen ligase